MPEHRITLRSSSSSSCVVFLEFKLGLHVLNYHLSCTVLAVHIALNPEYFSSYNAPYVFCEDKTKMFTICIKCAKAQRGTADQHTMFANLYTPFHRRAVSLISDMLIGKRSSDRKIPGKKLTVNYCLRSHLSCG